ncbi:hypothetical protein [Actinomycetospora lemnae]|uniref:Uncharacterized protein n=1 Tax=Actinomycetospora lemnae TaxID=3019891 RepID=A0ABT5T2M9_9PSEU|nr:hypothetical protein [Actinomycetospora sp. DW7H6]MDD7969382.1 hypothetical protein [Actinomycetospora sp. DW7H6]
MGDMGGFRIRSGRRRAPLALLAVLAVVLAACGATSDDPTPGTVGPGERNPLIQPFASDSIWNTPIGSGAVYVPAGLQPLPGGETSGRVPQIDDEPIILTPEAPDTPILYSRGGFGGDRCAADPSRVLRTAPIPAGYVLPSDNKNQSAAILGPDRRTVINVQPLARCAAGGPATSIVYFPDTDLYGPGIDGAHGGSGLSALGGSIRLGELRPGQEGPRHVLKVNVYGRGELARCADSASCSRWPARKSDRGGPRNYGTDGDNRNAAMRLGALLALPPAVDIATIGLTTEPGRQLAWTLQNYGAYIVDDTNGPQFALNAEVGPAGSMREQFRGDWGYDFEVESEVTDNPWAEDVKRIRPLLQVVDNNGPASVGGGGTPRQPLLPPLGDPPPRTVVQPPLEAQPDPPVLVR